MDPDTASAEPKRLTFGQLRLTAADPHVPLIGTGPELLLEELVSPELLTVAVFLIVPQLAAVVAAVSVMVLVAPAATVPKSQVNVIPPATGELGEQAAASGPPTVQSRPEGSVSF